MKNKALPLSGLTEAQVNAAIAVAEVNGFKESTFNNTYNNTRNNYGYIIHDDNQWYWSTNGDHSEIITLEEWLFYGAPDWVVDIKQTDDEFIYTDDVGKFISIRSKSEHLMPSIVKTAIIIATRQQEEWDGRKLPPPVGTRCIIHKGVEVTINKVHKGQVLSTRDDGYMYLTRGDIFKPLPKYTDEELLAYALHRSQYPKSTPEDIESFYKSFNRESNVFLKAIKDGWKK